MTTSDKLGRAMVEERRLSTLVIVKYWLSARVARLLLLGTADSPGLFNTLEESLAGEVCRRGDRVCHEQRRARIAFA